MGQQWVRPPFTRLFATHPSIEQVFFNGGKAEELYRRRVLPTVQATTPHLIYQRLPSTSPACAAMSYEQKLAHRRDINRSCPRVISAGHNPLTAL